MQNNKIVPHHLYGHINGSQRYNVADWCKDTIPIIKRNDQKKYMFNYCWRNWFIYR